MNYALLVEILEGGNYLCHEVPNLNLLKATIAISKPVFGSKLPPIKNEILQGPLLTKLKYNIDLLLVLKKVLELHDMLVI